MNSMSAVPQKKADKDLALYEREALAVVPGKLASLMGSLLLGTLTIDFAGAPAEAETYAYLAGLGAGAALHFGSSVLKRGRKPFVKTVELVSSLSSAAILGSVAMLFGDQALAGVGSAVAMGIGGVTGLFCGMRGRVALAPVAAESKAKAEVAKERTLSERDRYMAAVHEAGHAMTLALVPADWRKGAFINIGNSSNVFTHVPRNDDMWALAPYRRWEMLMLLAGPVATDKAFGGAMEGGASDMRSWRHRAMSVLTAERTEGWTLAPDNEMEVALNMQLMKAMEREQTQALESFFELNAELHQELVEHLLANNGANAEDLDRFLERVLSCEEVEHALGI